jgi:phage-related baseplate assembly protein
MKKSSINSKAKLASNHRSLQEELKSLLESYAGPNVEEVRSIARESIEKYKTEGSKFFDSTEDIRKDRER